MSDWQQHPPGAPAPAAPQPGGFGPPQPQSGPTPPASPLAGLEVGELLQTTARIIGGNYGVFFAVALTATLPGTAIGQLFASRLQERVLNFQQSLLTSPGTVPDVTQLFSVVDIGLVCGGGLVNFALMYLAQAVLVYDVVENLAGRKPPMGQAIRTGLSRAPAVLVTAFLLTLVLTASVLPGLVLGILVVAGGAAAGSGAAGLAACCGLPLMLVTMLAPMFYASIAFIVAVPAAVIEDVGPVGALSRSLELTKGHRWRIFLALMALMLVVVVFSCVGGMCSGALSPSIDPTTGAFQAPSALGTMVSFVVQLFTQAIQMMLIAALAAVAYARLRGIRDGVDAQALAKVFA